MLFHRKCVVLVGKSPNPKDVYASRLRDGGGLADSDAFRIEGLRVSFTVKKTVKKEPNTAEIKIWNLSAATRAQITNASAPVVLSAGYPESLAVIFAGDTRTADHVREGPDWITVLRCGDGERAYQWARCSESFAPGTSLADVGLAVGKAMGVGLGNLREAMAAAGSSQFVHGYTAHGKASTVFSELMKTAKLTWSIQGGALQVLQGGKAFPGSAVLLTPDTGLIGSPDHDAPDKKKKPSKLKFKALLNPALRCGGIVEIRSRAVQGQFRCESVEFTGDTAGGDWYVTGEGLAA